METLQTKQNKDQLVKLSGVNYEAKVNLSPLNKRIVIKDWSGSNLSGLKQRLKEIGTEKELTKFWVKAPSSSAPRFPIRN